MRQLQKSMLISLAQFFYTQTQQNLVCGWWDQGTLRDKRPKKVREAAGKAGQRLETFASVSAKVLDIEVALSFLFQLCEGHNLESQNTMRVQRNANFNLVSLMVDSLLSILLFSLPDGCQNSAHISPSTPCINKGVLSRSPL
jgi:hypothetical protein